MTQKQETELSKEFAELKESAEAERHFNKGTVISILLTHALELCDQHTQLRQQNERMKAAMLEAIEHSGVPGYVESILREALK